MNSFTVKDSFSFAKDIKQFEICNKNMASFDVTSLFTNIPLDETIKICLDLLYSNNDIIHGFNRQQMHKLLDFAVKDCYFIFNEKFFKQIDGVAMGSPLGPTLANIFLCHHEQIWINNCPNDFKPIYYRRYVDDTFTIFHSPTHVSKFLHYLNSQHPNIKFTSEVESEGRLAFLDVNILKINNKIETALFRKKTFTGLFTKFSSAIPVQFKRNLIFTLVNRAFNISSNYFHLHKELKYLKDCLMSNGFPQCFIDRFTGKQLNKLLFKPNLNPPTTVNKCNFYIPLIYTGHHSILIRNKLLKLLKPLYPQLNIRIIFKAQNSIGQFFNIKDRIPDCLQSCIIYKYTCFTCQGEYIGKTERHLEMRICEHLGKSFRTNNPLSSPPYSAIRQHSHNHDHPIAKNAFSIVAKPHNRSDLILLESLYSYVHKPTIVKENPSPLLCF